MKGYWICGDYMGYLPSEGEYCRFDTEEEYVSYYREFEES